MKHYRKNDIHKRTGESRKKRNRERIYSNSKHAIIIILLLILTCSSAVAISRAGGVSQMASELSGLVSEQIGSPVPGQEATASDAIPGDVMSGDTLFHSVTFADEKQCLDFFVEHNYIEGSNTQRATASDAKATASDAQGYDEDGILLDGEVLDDSSLFGMSSDEYQGIPENVTVLVEDGLCMHADQFPENIEENDLYSMIWVDNDLNLYTSYELLDTPVTQSMILYGMPMPMVLGGPVMPLSLGLSSVSMVDKSDGKISDPSDFVLGSESSTQFTISVSMDTNEQESFEFIIPEGFSATMINLPGFTRTETTLPNGDKSYTYVPGVASSQGSFECLVTVDYPTVLDKVADTTPRTSYGFESNIISQDGLTKTPGTGFTIDIPEIAVYSLAQVDTVNNNFTWNPYQLAGPTVNYGVRHYGNQADTLRPGLMTKKLEIEIQKDSGSTLQSDWSLDLQLPLYWKKVSPVQYLNNALTGVYYPHAPMVEIYVNGTWKTMQKYTNAFNMLTYPAAGEYDVRAGNTYLQPSNYSDNIQVKEQVLTLNPSLVDSLAKDNGLGTEKTVYEWFSEATAIRVSFANDVMWDPAYNGQEPQAAISSSVIADNAETFTADAVTTLNAQGVVSSTPSPLVINLVNGTDLSMDVGVAVIDEIKMNAMTSKTTTERAGVTRVGYPAAFATARNTNYSYFTNMVASYDFPWEYSPSGTITLCPKSEDGSYRNERNLTCYDYTLTISKTDGTTRVESYPHTGFINPGTGLAVPANTADAPYPDSITPTLAADEWVSNITVSADKVWKQNYTTDTSVFSNTTANHPLFYCNYASKGTYVNGMIHNNGDIVTVNSKIQTDQTGTINGTPKNVKLIGPLDNILLWSNDASGNRYPIGEYGDTKLQYISLNLRKFADTVTYSDPYIEVTGDAAALLNKITYETAIVTGGVTKTTHLVLRGYRLNTGAWVDVSAAQAATLLNAAEGYYDISSLIPAGNYLTGIRLAPLELNSTVVDTLTAPQITDPYDGNVKYYQEDRYYLYLYDKVLPGYLGYDDTLATTYGNITDLDSPLTFDLTFHCDDSFLAQNYPPTHNPHVGEDHLKSDMIPANLQSATLIYGDLPDSIFGRDNNYDILTSWGGDGGHRIYSITELTCVAIDDGPASDSTIYAWGEMQYATLKFDNTTADEKRMLALTKGVSLIGANWQGSSYLTPEDTNAVIRYKTHDHDSAWTVIDPVVSSYQGADRAVNYFTLDPGDYVTAIEVDYPSDFLYRSGYSTPGVENPNMRHLQIPDVGLLTNGQIPTESPVEGDSHIFFNGEQLPYHSELQYVDLTGSSHSYGLDYMTARLVPYPTMLVDDFTTSVSYDSPTVYQTGDVVATLTQQYAFTLETQAIDPTRTICPTLCYQIDKNFTIADLSDLATSLGINDSQVSMVLKNDGSGDSILRIKNGPLVSQTRNVPFITSIKLTAKPNATPTNVTPIKASWLTIDWDNTLDITQEGEYVSVNSASTQLEVTPSQVLPDADWATGTRLALVTAVSDTININSFRSNALLFFGTNGSGGGLSYTVTSHDSTDTSIFGVTETLYAPANPSTNWVVYIAVPSKGQEVPFGSGSLAAASDYSLAPTAGGLSIDPIAGTTFTTQYFVPSAATLVPSMAGLTLYSTDSVQDIIDRDDAADIGLGEWKNWSALSETERNKVSYVRFIADSIPATSSVSSSMLMGMSSDTPKTEVGTMNAYSSLTYNYLKNDGNMAYPNATPGNMAINGTGSNFVTYKLIDFNISGQLWQEANFNNTFVTAAGDILTSDGMTLNIVDAGGNPLVYAGGGTVSVTVNADGTYTVPVPTAGNYYLTLTSTQKNWLPVIYNGENIQNGMQFVPGKDKDGFDIAANLATATVNITTDDKEYVNAGIEEWGNLKIVKNRPWSEWADLSKEYTFTVTPQGSSIQRTYAGTIVRKPGDPGETRVAQSFEGATDTSFILDDTDYLTVSMPVGLGYTITESTEGYTTTVTTLENGSAPGGIVNPQDTTIITNEIVSISYINDPVNGDGGNEETFINTARDIVPSGIKGLTFNVGIPVLLALLCMCFMMIVTLKRKRSRR